VRRIVILALVNALPLAACGRGNSGKTTSAVRFAPAPRARRGKGIRLGQEWGRSGQPVRSGGCALARGVLGPRSGHLRPSGEGCELLLQSVPL